MRMRIMKLVWRKQWFGLSLILLSAAFAGCSGGKGEKVIMLGSNTIGEELAPQLIAEYKKEHPTVAFELRIQRNHLRARGTVGGPVRHCGSFTGGDHERSLVGQRHRKSS